MRKLKNHESEFDERQVCSIILTHLCFNLWCILPYVFILPNVLNVEVMKNMSTITVNDTGMNNMIIAREPTRTKNHIKYFFII